MPRVGHVTEKGRMTWIFREKNPKLAGNASVNPFDRAPRRIAPGDRFVQLVSRLRSRSLAELTQTIYTTN